MTCCYTDRSRWPRPIWKSWEVILGIPLLIPLQMRSLISVWPSSVCIACTECRYCRERERERRGRMWYCRLCAGVLVLLPYHNQNLYVESFSLSLYYKVGFWIKIFKVKIAAQCECIALRSFLFFSSLVYLNCDETDQLWLEILLL